MKTRKLLGFSLLVITLLIGIPHFSIADPLDNWHWRYPLPQGNTLVAIAYGNGAFVAVGEFGSIVTSQDGVTWTNRISGTSYNLNGVTYGNGTFVAVGGGILTAPDGVTWTERISGSLYDLNGATFGNGTFVAVGYGSSRPSGFHLSILTSPDGVSWTSRTPLTIPSYYLYGVTYGNGTFVTVGGNGTILTSPDGVIWTERTPSWPSPSFSVSGVTYGNGTFVAVWNGTIETPGGTILTSPDGVTWTLRSSGTSNELNGVTYGNGTFVAVGGNGTILTSPDGVIWTERTPWTSKTLHGVTYAYGTFVAVGENGTILQSDPVLNGIINLPKTGQTKCYDSLGGGEINCAGTGQDGESQAGVEWPEPRFTVSGDCVTDNLTGLMWAKNGNLPNGTKTWQGALDYVASINYGSGLCGHKDWRLPNVNELESLINSGEANTANWLNSQGFSNVQSNYYWSPRRMPAIPITRGSSVCGMAPCTTTISPTTSTCGQYVPDSLEHWFLRKFGRRGKPQAMPREMMATFKKAFPGQPPGLRILVTGQSPTTSQA